MSCINCGHSLDQSTFGKCPYCELSRLKSQISILRSALQGLVNAHKAKVPLDRGGHQWTVAREALGREI